LEHDLWFEEYVKHYTNAPVIINEEFADTEDLDGLFSGWDPEQGRDDTTHWQYAGREAHGAAGQREEGFDSSGEQSGHGGHGGGLPHSGAAHGGETPQHTRRV